MKRKNRSSVFDCRAVRVFTTKLANFGPYQPSQQSNLFHWNQFRPISTGPTRQTFVQAENFTGACRIVLFQSDLWITHVASALR
jgi:hypothetical protein